MCEDFARERLKNCPRDVTQRIEDGFGSVLSVLGNACGTFPFKTMIEAPDPLSALPVLFSSQQFTSPEVVPAFPRAPWDQCEYWYGLEPKFSPRAVENTLCARCVDTSHWLGPDGSWYSTFLFKSVPGVCLLVTNVDESFPKDIIIQRLDGSSLAIGLMPVVTACQLSANGQTFFVRDAVGWKRHQNAKNWIAVGRPDADSELNTSFDGQTFVQANPNSPDYHYKIGTATLKTKTLPAGDDGTVYSAVWGRTLPHTIFIARGKKLYAVGSLNIEHMVFELSGDAGTVVTGLWADTQTLWLSTDKGTLMSSDGAWTWAELNNVFAVGPGLFVKPNDARIFAHSDESFAEAVGYPLLLNNGGLLYSDVNAWATGYQEQTRDDQVTTIEATDTAALSPNGQYLLTQADGVVALYLNVWNSAQFAAWCKAGGNDCQAAYARYCQLFKTDARCKASTPKDPDDPKGGLPPLAIVLISIVGLGLIGALLSFVLKKRKSKSTSKSAVANPLNTP